MNGAELSSAFGKKYVPEMEGIHSAEERHTRIAREALRDLMQFNNALESEMHAMMAAVSKGSWLDHALLDKMNVVRKKYGYAMSGFKSFDDEMQRFALTALADAIQDLMFYLHTRRSN